MVALFPSAKFEILVPSGELVAGTRAEGVLVVTAGEDIPRAKHVELVFRSIAESLDGGRHKLKEEIFRQQVVVELPNQLAKGTHRFPFALDPPDWLPPTFVGHDCDITHDVVTHVDVDWAVDPKATIVSTVRLPPRDAETTPIFVRSPRRFHEAVVVEITVASSVLAQDDPLVGRVALHAAPNVEFESLELAMASIAHVHLGLDERRRNEVESRIVIPRERLMSGEALPFTIPGHPHLPPSFTGKAIDNNVVLTARLNVRWSFDHSFDIPLTMLPRGSVIHGDTVLDAVGGDRTREVAKALAEATGLHEGRGGVLATGGAGIVLLRISEVPRAGGLAVDLSYSYPDLELGIVFRGLGPLEGFRQSPLLPTSGFDNYLLRTRHEGLTPDFIATFLGDLGPHDTLHFSDTSLEIERRLESDSAEWMIDLAERALDRAKAISRVVDALPFPAAVRAAEPAWRALAAEEDAGLVPAGPAIHGIELRPTITANEQRTFRVTLRTIWAKEVPHDRVLIDLREAPLPEAMISALENHQYPAELAEFRAAFPSLVVSSNGVLLTLDRPVFSMDPRELWPAIEAVVTWVLDVRGERRASMPYR